MIRYQPDAAHQAVATCPPSLIETDPVQILATAMIELQACGQTVTLQALITKTALTRAEIDQHSDAAVDAANLRLRRAA